MREIRRRDIERFQVSLRGEKTPGTTLRKGATVNRYVYLLSGIFSRAIRDEIVDFNPCRDRTTGQVSDYAYTGVSASTLRSGFEQACERAGIPFGQTVEGGLIWHDLRRTLATELRARQVHEYDISVIRWAIQSTAWQGHMRGAHRKLWKMQ